MREIIILRNYLVFSVSLGAGTVTQRGPALPCQGDKLQAGLSPTIHQINLKSFQWEVRGDPFYFKNYTPEFFSVGKFQVFQQSIPSENNDKSLVLLSQTVTIIENDQNFSFSHNGASGASSLVCKAATVAMKANIYC